MGGKRGTVEERFWRFVGRPTDPDACWTWYGAQDGNGYGHLAKTAGHPIKAYVVSYQIHNGTIPTGLEVRHTCDNSLCTNPKHLVLGTHADNMRDAKERLQINRGEKNGQAKLTWAKVRRMRDYYLEHKPSFERLGRRFGVSPMAAWNVINNKTWRVGEATKTLSTGGRGKS